MCLSKYRIFDPMLVLARCFFGTFSTTKKNYLTVYFSRKKEVSENSFLENVKNLRNVLIFLE